MACVKTAVQMYIPFRGSSAPVPQKRAGYIHAGSLVDLGCGSMAEEMTVQVFIKTELIFCDIKYKGWCVESCTA